MKSNILIALAVLFILIALFVGALDALSDQNKCKEKNGVYLIRERLCVKAEAVIEP